MSKLALLGGEPLIKNHAPLELFAWPIITDEDKAAVMRVVETNSFSQTNLTEEFEGKFAKWQGRKYAVAYTNGTMSLAAAMFAVGIGAGDEIICTTKTYWASIAQAVSLGATPVFCNIGENLNMDVDHLEKCITKKTKAIMVVHLYAYPCEMDRIMEIANKHGIYVIEDVSHAQGSVYKGTKCGNFGHISAMSLMSCKSLAAGELGVVVTDDKKLYERAIAYGHYERNNANYITESEDLKEYYHIPLGGVKGRVNQLCAVLGMGQLKYFDERCVEIRKAMNYFFDCIEGIPGIVPRRIDESTGSHMGAYYIPSVIYEPSAFEGLSSKRFSAAVSAEFNGAFNSWEGGNYCLHTHQYFKTYDFLHLGKPSRIVFMDDDVRQRDKECDSSLEKCCFSVPWFKKYDKEWIEKYASVIRKVAENYKDLLEGDVDKIQGGRWHGTENAKIQQKTK